MLSEGIERVWWHEKGYDIALATAELLENFFDIVLEIQPILHTIKENRIRFDAQLWENIKEFSCTSLKRLSFLNNFYQMLLGKHLCGAIHCLRLCNLYRVYVEPFIVSVYVIYIASSKIPQVDN